MNRLSLSVIVALAMGACGGKAADVSHGVETAQVAVARAPLVAGYEALRDRLASDDLPGAKAAAEALGKVGLAAQADAVAKAGDIEAARVAFGDLSKAYLEQLVKAPDLQKGGLFAFRCPMAKGYQKWVQTDETMKNPYMGKAMLECGSKVDLVP